MTTEETPVQQGTNVVAWLATRVILPAGFVFAGVACAGLLLSLRGGAEVKAPEALSVLVTTEPTVPATLPARITATGIVQAAHKINLVAEVSGKVTWTSPELVRGGRFRKGDVLARIDARDQEAALAAERAKLRQAELDLTLEQNRKGISQREWEALGDPSRSAEQSALALRTPYLALAEANVAAAKAAVARAELNVSRTRLTAPFDATVLTESLDVGQYIGPGTAAVALQGTDGYLVEVSVPAEQLGALSFPVDEGGRGSPANVSWARGGGEALATSGHALRLVQQLDEQTRTATVVVEIDAPTEGDTMLLTNAFVDVELVGGDLADVVRVPRVALDGDAAVWVADSEAQLSRREVTVLWREAQHVLVPAAAFRPGDRVITSPLGMPVEGARVREVTDQPEAAASQAE